MTQRTSNGTSTYYAYAAAPLRGKRAVRSET
jgi:hypothetical protein